ncbi:hypothetical protein KC19_2G009900 [Ceratodon purpureus]|uniref:Uncharacterized protein n=1 Tax=Ceratodon purpureus TaxID=3225 RepID=A0A8T0ISN4_CERPU|nr:hypothetical protein KC19_2G009900 [Ceratodon purpureus]
MPSALRIAQCALPIAHAYALFPRSAVVFSAPEAFVCHCSHAIVPVPVPVLVLPQVPNCWLCLEVEELGTCHASPDASPQVLLCCHARRCASPLRCRGIPC